MSSRAVRSREIGRTGDGGVVEEVLLPCLHESPRLYTKRFLDVGELISEVAELQLPPPQGLERLGLPRPQGAHLPLHQRPKLRHGVRRRRPYLLMR